MKKEEQEIKINKVCKGCTLWKHYKTKCWFWYKDKQDCLNATYETAGGLDKKLRHS